MEDPMRIAMVFPGVMGFLPPAVTAAVGLRAERADVSVIAAGCEGPTRDVLARGGVACQDLGVAAYPENGVRRATLRATFGLHLRRSLRALRPHVLWYHGAHAMQYRRQAKWVVPAALSVAHAHELYDEHPRLRRQQERAISASSCWIAPEPNRAALLRDATGSTAPHWIVPNRPLETLGPPPGGGRDTEEIFQRHGGSPVCRHFVIYQGLIAASRCLLEIVDAFCRISRPDVGLIILGDGPDRRFGAVLAAAARGNDRIVLVRRIAPPDHLRVTIGADVGLLLYAPTSLNGYFCAPTKLFEYAWCGLGVVMPSFPALEEATRRWGFGQRCDPLSPESIADAIKCELGRDPQERHASAAAFLRASPSPLSIYREVAAHLRTLLGNTARRG
jgi:glycosyltransferase involved in cell wall biosynthesis